MEASQGYTGLGVYSVIVDPLDPSRVMAKNFASLDGGQTWKSYPIPEFETYAIWRGAAEANTRIIAGAEGMWIGQIGSADWQEIELVDLAEEITAGRIEDERMKIAALGVSPTNDQIIYAGYAHGQLCPGTLGVLPGCSHTRLFPQQ